MNPKAGALHHWTAGIEQSIKGLLKATGTARSPSYTSSVETWRSRSTFSQRAASSRTLRPVHIRPDERPRLQDRAARVGLRGEVRDRVTSLHRPRDRLRVADVRLEELDLPSPEGSQRFDRSPAYVSVSRTRTSYPRVTAIRVKFDPNPAPPVTRSHAIATPDSRGDETTGDNRRFRHPLHKVYDGPLT